VKNGAAEIGFLLVKTQKKIIVDEICCPRRPL
jgi:hypothetical protein